MVFWKVNSNNLHACTLSRKSETFLEPLEANAGCFERFKRAFRRCIQISEHNPQSKEFYRSNIEILAVRKKHALRHPHIIHPFSIFRSFYEMWMAFVFLMAMIYMPTEATFDIDADKHHSLNWLKMGNLLICIACLADVVMTFFTGYAIPKEKRVELRPSRIAKKYLLSPFFYMDVVSSFPDTSLFFDNYRITLICDLFRLLKIARLPTLFFYLRRTAELISHISNIFAIVKYIVIVIVVVHWFACLQFLVPQLRDLEKYNIDNRSWIAIEDIVHADFWTKYLRCYYRSVGYLLCTTTGMRPTKLPEEILLSVITLVFGKLYFLCLTVTVLQMLLATRSLETKYYSTISQVKAYMSQKKLPIDLQKKILQYYDYKYSKKFFKENVISGLLSDNLKKEINANVCRKLVKNVSLFSELPIQTVEEILTLFKTEIFLPNDIIIKSGSLGDCMYFLASGTVSVSTPSGKEICHLQDGAYFGEIALIRKDKRRTANILAIEICELYKLSRRAFMKCISKHEATMKKIENMALERLNLTEAIEDAHRLSFLEI